MGTVFAVGRWFAGQIRGYRQTEGEPLHRGIVAIDIEGFGRRDRTDPVRARLRERLHALVKSALAAAGIPGQKLQQSGDELLVLVDPRVSVARLLHPLVPCLAGQLATLNQHSDDANRLRLRMAVHDGPVLADSRGYTGAAIIHAFRLLNARVLRDVLRKAPAADLVLVVSDHVWQSIVSQEYPGIDPAGFRPVWAHVKETRTRAWVHVVGPSAVEGRARTMVAFRQLPPSSQQLDRLLENLVGATQAPSADVCTQAALPPSMLISTSVLLVLDSPYPADRAFQSLSERPTRLVAHTSPRGLRELLEVRQRTLRVKCRIGRLTRRAASGDD